MPTRAEPTQSELMKFGYVNIRSVCNKASVVNDHITENELDIMIITETWLSKTNEDRVKAELLPCGYSIVHRMRSEKRGGGIAVVHRSNLAVKTRNCSPQPKTFECLEVHISHHCFPVCLLVIYRPPENTTTEFIDEFADMMTQYACSTTKALVVGDFNIHWEVKTDPSAMRLKSVLQEADFMQHVTGVTHVAGHTLDLVISKGKEKLVKSVEISSLLSDHFALHGRLCLKRPPRPKKEVTFRSFKRLDHDAFARDVVHELVSLNAFSDIDDQCNQLNAKLRSLLDHHVPLITRTITLRQNSQWMNDEILEVKRDKRRYERLWKKTKLAVHLTAYKAKRNELTSVIQKAKERHEEAKIAACGNNQKALFRCTKRLLQGDTKPNCPLTPQVLSDFFETKVTGIRDSLPVLSTSPFAYDTGATTNLRTFTAVSEEEVKRVVMKSASKSCDLDPWPAWLVKEHLASVLPSLTHIINASLIAGEVPNSMKKAIITPILKKKSLDPTEPSHYRPVANLSFASKVLERIVCSQLTRYLDENSLHHPYQSAYRPRHSVETALLKVHNDIATSIDQKKQVVLIMLDLSAAFDTVDHHILLHRLQHRFGLQEDALKWVDSYLKERYQVVKVGRDTSSSTMMQCGVPQGSVLGPVLFSLYISPLYDIIRQCGIETHQYADDCQLYIELQTDDDDCVRDAKSQLEECITKIADWMSANKLKLNDGKTEAIVFSSSSMQIPLSLNAFLVCETNIERTNSVKDLGVILDQNLNAEQQVNAICAACYYHLSNISAIRNSLGKAAAEKLLHAFISSKMDFCNSLLTSLPNRLIAKIQRVQNAAARMLTRTPRREHITPVLVNLHWLPVKYRIDYKIAVITWKALHDQAPTYVRDMLRVRHSTRDLRSSAELLLETPIPRTLTGKRAFNFAGPNVFNNLPAELRCVPDFSAFKRHLKTFLFTKAFY